MSCSGVLLEADVVLTAARKPEPASTFYTFMQQLRRPERLRSTAGGGHFINVLLTVDQRLDGPRLRSFILHMKRPFVTLGGAARQSGGE